MPHGRTAVNSRISKDRNELCVSKNRNIIFQNSPPQDEPIVAYCGTANCYAEIYSFVVCLKKTLLGKKLHDPIAMFEEGVFVQNLREEIC